MDRKLVIGNKNYSSWSLRPWLFLTHNGVPFDEIRIPLYAYGAKEKVAVHSASGLVPALVDGDLKVHDSLAICEYVSETYLQGRGWPEDSAARAVARAISAEMHAGFVHLRKHLSMNVRARFHWQFINQDVENEVARILQLWKDCRLRYARNRGPWLFGEFSIADAMYAPVCLRFSGYNVPLPSDASEYVRNMLQLPAMQAWCQAALQEKEVIGWAENAQLLRIEDCT